MITTIRVHGVRDLLCRAPAFGVALTVAEIWFRFGSFALECVAFLGVWATLDALTTSVVKRARRGELSAQPR